MKNTSLFKFINNFQSLIGALYFLFFPFQTGRTQVLTAGQTINVSYTDIDPDIVLNPGPGGGDFYSLDINNDGTKDFDFAYTWTVMAGGEWKKFSVNQFNGYKIAATYAACQANSFTAVYNVGAPISFGDTINFQNNWKDTTIILYTYNWFNPPIGNAYGCSASTSSNFLCFRKEVPSDTIYGWIKVSGGSISEYAFTSTLINKSRQIELNLVSAFPNPINDILKIQNPKENDCTIILLDVLGNIILEDNIQNLSKDVDTSQLKRGIYFLHIRTENQHTLTKVIKLWPDTLIFYTKDDLSDRITAGDYFGKIKLKLYPDKTKLSESLLQNIAPPPLMDTSEIDILN